MDTVYQILTYALGGSSLLGAIGSIAWWRQTKRVKEAEAKQKEAEAEMVKVDVEKAKVDARKLEIERLTAQLDHQQKTIDNLLEVNNNLSGRLSALNTAIDKHIDRNRELSDRLYKSETELNIANARITSLTEELGNERLQRKHYQMWRCERNDCKDPRGPKPPRSELEGIKYLPPARAVK